MTLAYVFFGYVLIVIVLKISLQRRWTRQLYSQYADLYSYGFIFRKIGRSNYGRLVLQHNEGLDPTFLGDLKRAQHRSFVWDLSLGAIWLAMLLMWLIWKRLGF